MIIGVPKEIKNEEFRVAITPENVSELVKEGHRVLVEKFAGEGSGFSDEAYRNFGAEIVEKKEVFQKADLIVKVKEPLSEEYDLLKEGQAIFTYLHLAANRPLTEFLLKKKIIGLAYETLEVDGKLPLLEPMSEIAGRMSPIIGAYFLQYFLGGEGVLPTGTISVAGANVVILGAGSVGSGAAKVAIGMGMETVVMAKSDRRLKVLKSMYSNIKTEVISEGRLQDALKSADIVIGAVLVPGGKTPLLVKKEMLKMMKKGAVIVDVSIDQGGCFETSMPTTHQNPVYVKEGVVHYAVTNMPGAYPKTSTIALSKATLPYIKLIASLGIEKALKESKELKTALNTYNGEIVNTPLKESMEKL